MEKQNILFALTAPVLIALYGVVLLSSNPIGGFADLAGAITLAVAIFSALIAGGVLFFLRARTLQWWHAILISIGGVIVAFSLLVLFVRIADNLSGFR